MHKLYPVHAKRMMHLLIMLLLAVTSYALAYDSLTFGVQASLPTDGLFPVTVNAAMPLVALEGSEGTEGVFAARVDLTHAFGGDALPVGGVSIILSTTGSIQGYAGFGVGMLSTSGAKAGYQATTYSLMGVRVPVIDLLSVRTEAVINHSLDTVALQLGVDLTPWRK